MTTVTLFIDSSTNNELLRLPHGMHVHVGDVVTLEQGSDKPVQLVVNGIAHHVDHGLVTSRIYLRDRRWIEGHLLGY